MSKRLFVMLFSPAMCLAIGFALGIFSTSVWFARLPIMAGLSNVSTQRAEVVLVVQTATPVAIAAEPPTPQLPSVTTADTLKGARAYLRAGAQDAQVQVVLFEDGQCPFCKQLSTGPVRQLIDDYVAAGKVAVTYRHYAFLGEESTRLAAAMECAGKQSKFWEYHGQAFANQQPENAGEVTDALLLDWATRIKLDVTAFKACLGDPAVQKLVAADFQTGQLLKVQGTPTLFINGQRLSGAVPYDFLKSKVEEALRAAK